MIIAGNVYWVTGLSGSGKTTISRLLVNKIREMNRPVVLLDGDAIRAVLEPITASWHPEFGYGREARRSFGLTYGRLAAELSKQGIDVVCATISMFHEVFQWNRSHIENYREIYLKVPIEILHQRDPKGIYARGRQTDGTSIAGVGLIMDEPTSADLIIENHGAVDPAAALDRVWSTLGPGGTALKADGRL